MKKGLILEGGAMRGMFSAGVMDVLMEAGIEFDGIVGVSAGAVFGCNYKSKQIGRTIRYNMKYVRDPRYCSLSSLIKTGDMFGRDFCYNIIPNELDLFDNDTFKNNPVKFYVVATDINSGKALYQRIDSADEKGLEYMRASASMPLVSKPVVLDGKEMLDGGIADSIPLEFFVNKGYDKNLVILTQPKDYVKKKNRLIRGGLFFETDYIIGRAVQDRADLFQRQHGDVVPLLDGIQRLIVDAGLQQTVLGDPLALHGFPHG